MGLLGGNRRSVRVLLRLGLLASLGISLTASFALASDRRASLVVDANTGRVLQSQAVDEPRHPASLAKMMTLYIVFELLEQGRLSPSTRIQISEAAADTPPSRLGLAAGSDIALVDAIKALITKSANDIAAAIAEHISGSQDKFARLMTQKARALGMQATVFKNPHGLPDDDQVTTARDMATLALHLNDDFPRWYPLFALRSFAYQGRSYRNHNTLLASFEGTDGIKTGYTAGSGFNLVASVRRDGKHLIGVIFGGTTAAARNAYMRALINRALVSASTRKTRQPMLVAQAHAGHPQAPVMPQAASPKPAERSKSTGAPTDEIARLMASVSETAVEAPEPRLARQTPIQIARVRQVLVRPPSRPVEVASASAGGISANDAVPASAAFQRASVTNDGPGMRSFASAGLQAQAERLARGQPAVDPPPAIVRSEIPVRDAYPARASLPATGPFAIQIGAYSSESEAQRQLQAAKNRAGALLADRVPAAFPVDHSGRKLYRARFAGFDAQGAAAACAQLHRLRVDCVVAKPD